MKLSISMFAKPIQKMGWLAAAIVIAVNWQATLAENSPPVHRSLQPVRAISPPENTGDSWSANDIDRFILSGLKGRSLAPSPAAPRGVFIRRLYLIGLGLPPTVQETQDFQRDPSPEAYERLVDHVLASPRYGETWASHWLDLVHFAETTGFEMNNPRSIAWPYRDWVIEAFNRDEPYNDFIIDQLAGDTRGNDAATGFLVAGPNDLVKSPDIVLTATQRHEELRDIVNTTSTAFLGLTVACATCHDHKFDPITQSDFYRFKAVFAGVHHGERSMRPALSSERNGTLATLQHRRQAIEAALERFEPLAAPGTPDSSKPQRSAVNSKENIEHFAPVLAKYIRFTVLATNGAEPCIDELGIFSTGENPVNVALRKSGAIATASGCYPNNPRHKIEHINDGLFGNDHSWISNENGRGWIQIELATDVLIDRITWGRDRQGQFQDRLPTVYRIEIATEPGNWKTVADSSDRAAFGSKLASNGEAVAGLSSEDLRLRANLQGELREIDAKIQNLQTPSTVYAGRFEPAPAIHRLYRGDPMSEKEEVSPGAIESLGHPLKLTTSTPEQDRRLALARWIASPDNPLTARVMVNRIWQHTFGEGIVSTPSDFGKMGTPPSNPELLDYLASQFMQHGWSIKHIQREIFLSASFRQSSRPIAQAMQLDAGDRLLWRFPPRRLEAEAIHDSILSVSNKLDLRPGGPGYSGFVPNENYVRVYEPKEDFGPAEWRRMVYQTRVRMQIDGTFGAFDCPDAGQVAPKRTRSTTPLQALNLLNGHFVIQQAGFFADRLKTEAGDSAAAQVDLAFHLAFGREPASEESAAALQLIPSLGLPAFCRAIYNANEFVFVN